jgi:archaemetzincin
MTRTWPRIRLVPLLALLAIALAAVWWRLSPPIIFLRSVRLEFVPVGEIDVQLVREVAQQVAEVYDVPYSVVAEPWPLPKAALEPHSGKYRAGIVRDDLKRRPRASGVHQIGLTDADLTVGDMNFVFGYAQMPGTTATMSLARLRPKAAREGEDAAALLRERAVRIAVHELGHTFGLGHCSDERCVMAYTETAAGVDLGGREFCPRCRARFRH